MSTQSDQLDSPLLQLPSEIRNQIWHLVFHGHHVMPSKSGPQLAQDDCRACITIACTNVTTGASTSDYPAWQEVFRPLRVCKQIYNEAKDILRSSFTLHLGSTLGLPDSLIALQWAQMRNHVRRLEWRVHMLEETRADWTPSIAMIGTLFPNLERLNIHAHMRPPDNYEILIDGMCVFPENCIRLP